MCVAHVGAVKPCVKFWSFLGILLGLVRVLALGAYGFNSSRLFCSHT